MILCRRKKSKYKTYPAKMPDEISNYINVDAINHEIISNGSEILNFHSNKCIFGCPNVQTNANVYNQNCAIQSTSFDYL